MQTKLVCGVLFGFISTLPRRSEINFILRDVHLSEPTRTHVDFDDFELSDTEVTHLARALDRNAIVTHLDLSHNDVGPLGAKALARVLKSSKCIVELVLTNCRLEAGGARGLCDSSPVFCLLYIFSLCKSFAFLFLLNCEMLR
jgi:hypothetical protein